MAAEAARERCLTWCRRNRKWSAKDCDQRFDAPAIINAFEITSLLGRPTNGISMHARLGGKLAGR